MRVIACDISDDVLTPEQREKLEAFFADADEKNRRGAMHIIDRALRLRRAYTENPSDRGEAAKQVWRIKKHLDGLLDELTGLSAGTIEALHIAGQKQSELFRQVVTLRCLSATALEDMPKVDDNGELTPGRPRGIVETDWCMAGELAEAFALAFGQLPARNGKNSSEIKPLFKILGIYYPSGTVLKIIKNMKDAENTEYLK